MIRKCFLLLLVCLVGPVYAEPLTLPIKKRPAWLARDGIVMAGSWEPLLFRVRRDGSPGYTPTAEQRTAFNRDCLGAICWFEYDKIHKKPGVKEPMSDDLRPFIRFFHKRRDLLRDAEVVADLAVLRSFPSQVHGSSKHATLTYKVENALIENHGCFQTIYQQQLDRLSRYRCLVLAGCVALSDRQIAQIRAYVKSGGRVCVIGPAATHDEWMKPRKKPALADLPASSVVRAGEGDDYVAAIRRACRDKLALSVESQPGLCTELTEQAGRRLVHFVNYRLDEPARNVKVGVRLPADRRVKGVTLASPCRAGDLELSFKQDTDMVSFVVPEVAVYEIAAIAME